jgi:hypothetical protein
MTTKTTETTEVRIVEQGNGLPDVGDYVPGPDGELYRVVAFHDGYIQTGRWPGEGDWIRAHVVRAALDDCAEGEEHPSVAVIPDEEDDDEWDVGGDEEGE